MSGILSKDSLILITGLNGYIASHIADQLLAMGYQVRGTVRDTEKSSWLLPFFENKHGPHRVELVQVADMTVEGCFDKAVVGCSGFIHSASDVSLSPDPKKVIPLVVSSVTNSLSAAAKEPNMKTFVYTSSSTSASDKIIDKVYHINSKSWNLKSIEEAWGPTPDSWSVYSASKAQGEQALWKWTEEHSPAFTVNAILPNMNIGPVLSPDNQPGSSTQFFLAAFTGHFDQIKDLPPQYHVDVRDNARLHAALATDTSYNKERVLAYAEAYYWNKIFAIGRRIRPDLDVPADIDNKSEDMSVVDTALALDILKQRFGQDGWIAFEESLRGTLQKIPPRA